VDEADGLSVTKVRIGIQTSQENIDWPQLLDFWRFLDTKTKFDSVWTMDHFVPPGPGEDESGPCMEGWATLTAGAQATERLRFGCLVTGNTYRHPAVLAKMAATVDVISNGRLELGIGAAWHEREHGAYGIAFPSVKERQDRLEEAVQIIRLLFDSSGPVDFHGTYYQLDHAPFSPKCVQRPHAPIFVGGDGEKRTLRTAARYGDGINVSGGLDTVRHKIEVLERHCRDAGRDPNEITKSLVAPVIVLTDEERAKQARARFAPMFGLTPEQAEDQLIIGTAEHARRMIQRFAGIGISYITMMSRAPYKTEVYQRISDEVVAAFA
jgi:F420-dependent oxidoreductase-like protein